MEIGLLVQKDGRRNFYVVRNNSKTRIPVARLREEGDLKVLFELKPEEYDLKLNAGFEGNPLLGRAELEKAVPHAKHYRRENGGYMTLYRNPGVVWGREPKERLEHDRSRPVRLSFNRLKGRYCRDPSFQGGAKACIQDYLDNARDPLGYLDQLVGNLTALFESVDGEGYCQDMCSLVDSALENFANQRKERLYSCYVRVNCTDRSLSERREEIAGGVEPWGNHCVLEVTHPGKYVTETLLVDTYCQDYSRIVPLELPQGVSYLDFEKVT